MNKLIELFQRAKVEQGNIRFFTPNGDLRATHKGSSSVRGLIDLNGDTLPKIQKADGTLKRAPSGTPAVENLKIDAAILRQSLVAQAGAEIIIYKDPAQAISTGLEGDVVMASKPAYFETFEAAPFALVADGDEVTVTPLPINRATIHVDATGGLQTDTGIYGLRFEFSRATLKSYPSIEDAIMHAIVQGLARTADAVLTAGIIAATPAAFSLAAAAAAGVRMSELRALVGTSGHGATIDNNGVLRAAGITAELTPDMAVTVIGSFARSAVMIRSDVDVIVDRTNINGTLAVTAWAGLQALVPDATRFWTVEA
ncbi:hypothetical protein [Paraburkholderia aspalathi]|uniref:hypothetical protein n=1 Tax=Paraburkholderia aspalathi TaxID=1324617 RepID=UPI001B0678DC|nr:hypothetical protein [Paraburkholderia aspalathi]CAE6852574.1 hypothetical protein R20943_07642 [Paraburkholderia aspalathi]